MTSIKNAVAKTILASVCLLPTLALADLKPDVLDCDPKKAARNAAVESGVGVSGKCDGKKMVDDAKDDAKNKIDDQKDKFDDRKDTLDDKKGDLSNKKDDLGDKMDNEIKQHGNDIDRDTNKRIFQD